MMHCIKRRIQNPFKHLRWSFWGNSFQPVTISAKSSVLDGWENFEYFSDRCLSTDIMENQVLVKDIHREKAPSNNTLAPRKSTNMGVWAVDTLNQLFIRGS